MNNESPDYESLLNMTYPWASRHPRMSMENRAAQFAPFSALTGHGAAIAETGRFTEEKIELSEDEQQNLSKTLMDLIEGIHHRPFVVVTYFKHDLNKSGGRYVSVSGIIKRIDRYERRLLISDNIAIPVDDILMIERTVE